MKLNPRGMPRPTWRAALRTTCWANTKRAWRIAPWRSISIPSSSLAWAARGNAYFLLGRYDEALADLKKASWYDPKNPDILQLIEKTQAKVDEIVAKAMEKEKAPETGTVQLPGETAKADPPPTPEPPSPKRHAPRHCDPRGGRRYSRLPPRRRRRRRRSRNRLPPQPQSSGAAALHARGRQALQDGKVRRRGGAAYARRSRPTRHWCWRTMLAGMLISG